MLQGRRRKAHQVYVLLILLVMLAPLLAGCTLRASGQELVESECTRCHTLAPIEVEGRTQAGWEDVVYDMIEHGADLTEGQVQRVVDYLAENYGPGQE